MSDPPILTFTIAGTIPSKKNNERIFQNRKTGKRIIAKSKAWVTFLPTAKVSIQQQLIHQCEDVYWEHAGCKLGLDIIVCRVSKGIFDIDNQLSSICDLLQDAGVMKNDVLVERVEILKQPGFDENAASIAVICRDHNND